MLQNSGWGLKWLAGLVAKDHQSQMCNMNIWLHCQIEAFLGILAPTDYLICLFFGTINAHVEFIIDSYWFSIMRV